MFRPNIDPLFVTKTEFKVSRNMLVEVDSITVGRHLEVIKELASPIPLAPTQVGSEDGRTRFIELVIGRR